MSNERSDAPRPAAAPMPPPARPEEHEAAWDRVLDCGAPGPARAEPILFYQPGRPPAPAAGAGPDAA